MVAPDRRGGGPLGPGEILHLDAHPVGPVAEQEAAHDPAPRVERVVQDGRRRAGAARLVAGRRAGRCRIEEPVAPRRVVDPGDDRGEGGRVRPPHLEADIEAVLVGLAARGRCGPRSERPSAAERPARAADRAPPPDGISPMSVLYPRARTPVLGLGQEGIEAPVGGGVRVLQEPARSLRLVSRFRSLVDSMVRSRAIRLAICCFCFSSSAIRSSAGLAIIRASHEPLLTSSPERGKRTYSSCETSG